MSFFVALYFTIYQLKNYNFIFHQYTGECSYYGVELIKEISKKNNFDFIIGVGGGKLVDLVGYTANILNKQFGVIPTLTSNCAPWTPLSVMYKENGVAEGKTEHFLEQASFFITDPRLIIDSPVEYFIAGIADTLAKWYELDLITAQNFLNSSTFISLARYIAKISKEILLEKGNKAIADMKNKVISDEFIQCSEIVFSIAGLVGGLGGKYSRNSAAHAIHDGISKYIHESHNLPHGEKVAYGIFYQLALENKWNIIDELIPYYDELNLPKSLHDMGIYPNDKTVIDDIIKFVNGKSKVHLLPIEINFDFLKDKLLELEEYISNK